MRTGREYELTSSRRLIIVAGAPADDAKRYYRVRAERITSDLPAVRARF